MSFSTVATIKLIDEYKKNISAKVFNIHEPYNLTQARKGIEFLSELIAESPGSDIQFQNYSQLMKYINYSEYITKINSLPTKSASSDELIHHIMEFRNINRAMLGQTYPNSIVNTIMFYSDLVKLYAKWQGVESHVVIPAEYQMEALKIIEPYYFSVKKLPKEKQQEVLIFLNKLSFPQQLFNTAKKNNNLKIQSILEKIRGKHSDKLEYINNIYFSVSKNLVDLSPGEYAAIMQLYIWTTSDIQDIYKIFPKDIDKVIKEIVDRNIINNRIKKQRKEQKEAMEMKKEEEKQKKMQKEADAENPLRKTISSAKQVTNVQNKIENIVGEIQTLQDPPNIEDLSHLGNELTTQENRIQQLFNEVMANINRT